MKKILAVLLAITLICCLPVIFAENGGVDSGITFNEYCSNCHQETSCERCSGNDYSWIDDFYHMVRPFEETVCTMCNSRWGKEYYDTEYLESHSWNEHDACRLCDW